MRGADNSFSWMWTDRLLHRSTILVVEPDSVTRQLLSRSLRPAYHLLQAASAEEAVRIAAQHRRNIDLFLTEARLPQLFGWELLELLELDYPKLKVVYLSKSIDREIRVHTRGHKVLVLEHLIVVCKPYSARSTTDLQNFDKGALTAFIRRSI